MRGGGRESQSQKWKGKSDVDARAVRCESKESEFPFSRRSAEGIGPDNRK